jgi:hypothetical protein
MPSNNTLLVPDSLKNRFVPTGKVVTDPSEIRVSRVAGNKPAILTAQTNRNTNPLPAGIGDHQLPITN